jgi:hypothetical protein
MKDAKEAIAKKALYAQEESAQKIVLATVDPSHHNKKVMVFLIKKTFLAPFVISLILTGGFFAWELGAFPSLPHLLRPDPTDVELIFTTLIVFLIALNMGLLSVRKRMGTCPSGAKRATGIAGILGAAALLCPVCIAVPLSLLGVSISLAFLSPFVPLLRIIALLLLIVSTKMLWPR